MTAATPFPFEGDNRAESGDASRELKAKPYSAPRVDEICDVEALLEVLGPAQANYGLPGFP